jgi:hypothetical protein
VAAWCVAIRRGRGRELECLVREVACCETTTAAVTRRSATPFCLHSRRARLGAPAAAMAGACRRQSRGKEERGGESWGRSGGSAA